MPIERPTIIALGRSHLREALALSGGAGWNQTLDDWRAMLAAGRAIGILGPDGRLAATALTLPCGVEFGWISMVLVAPGQRGGGLATRLLQRAIQLLERDGLTPCLDATPEGERVYRPLGFQPHFTVRRWQIYDTPAVDGTGAATVSRPPGKNEMSAIAACDRSVFGGDRQSILRALLARSGGCARITTDGTGYLLSRDGRMARQIGPICAGNPATAIGMLNEALAGLTGPLIIDAPDHQGAFVDHLDTLGFTSQRPFLRMAKDRNAPIGDPDQLFALAGPELG